MLHCLEDGVHVGGYQQVKFLLIHLADGLALGAQERHHGHRGFFLFHRQIVQKSLVTGALRLADQQPESVQVVIDIGHGQTRLAAGLPLLRDNTSFKRFPLRGFLLTVQRHQSLERGLNQSREHLFFAGKVLIQPGGAHACSGSDAAHGCIGKAIGQKFLPGCCHDLFMVTGFVPRHTQPPFCTVANIVHYI